ncbi:hypothetical protein HC891_23605 [Candidatus Gracilibacteria bacterium]|nr:hypothetical protein [Candidatus Gracilibacteria bacterium]
MHLSMHRERGVVARHAALEARVFVVALRELFGQVLPYQRLKNITPVFGTADKRFID